MTATRRRRTAQPLHNPRSVQERILAFGVEGTGKSEAWISVAVEAERTNSDATFYVIDTDGSAVVSLLAHPELTNIRIYQASDPDGFFYHPDGKVTEHGTWWEAYVEASKTIRRDAAGPSGPSNGERRARQCRSIPSPNRRRTPG